MTKAKTQSTSAQGQPIARAEMMIRRPAADVFAAFVEPAWLTRFWLSKVSAPLSLGAKVHWEFMVPGVTDEVTVTTFERNSRLAFRFSDLTETEILFEEIGPLQIRVAVRNWGFRDEPVESAIEASQGFSIVLCDLKSLLEAGQSGRFVADKAFLIARKTS